MSKSLNTLPWNATWVPACWPGSIHRDVMWPGPTRAPGGAGSHLPRSCHPYHLLCPLFFPPYYRSQSFSSILLISFQADSSALKVPEVPWLVFNPADGHLPLQNYQSVVNSLSVPLTHPVTLTFLLVAVIPAFCKVGPCRQTQKHDVSPRWQISWAANLKQISFQLNLKEFAVIAIYTWRL